MIEQVLGFINNNVSDKYKIRFETLTQVMPKECIFRPDSKKFKPIREFSGDMAYVTTYFHDTDLNILPELLREASLYDIRIKILEYWVRDNVFKYMYEHVEPTHIKTTDTKLRIAINQISNLKSLPSDIKLYWIEWLCELYRVRTRAVMEYYVKYIVKLPF